MARESFMGYGSPEALEKAITAEDGPDFIVHESLLFATVCSPLPQEEVTARMARRPCGTTRGWLLSDEPFSETLSNPCPCNDYPTTHKHYLFDC